MEETITDIYDFASAGNKISLKKWEIKLGLHHKELGLPWYEPVPKEFNPENLTPTDWDAINKIIHEECVKAQSKLEINGIVFASDVGENILKRLRGEA